MIGLSRYTVALVDHQSQWMAYAERRCQAIARACHEIDCDIQHVGSTAVPDLLAKPIIDIVVGLVSMGDKRKVQLILAELGYVYRGVGEGSTGHFFVLENSPDVRAEHVHVVAYGSTNWDSYVLFRDALRNSDELRRRYTELKQALKAKFPTNREEYTAEKASFISSVLSGIAG